MFPSTNTPRGLLASDLDGTLAIDGIIPLDAFDAAEKLHNHGISVLIVTGRNAKSLQRVEGIWKIADEIIFSSGAGLLVHPHAAPLERTYFPKSEITAIRDILDKETEDYCILDRIPNNHYFQWKQFRKPKKILISMPASIFILPGADPSIPKFPRLRRYCLFVPTTWAIPCIYSGDSLHGLPFTAFLRWTNSLSGWKYFPAG